MPIEFLTAEQKSRYGCFNGDPSPEQLSRYFYIDDHDRELIIKKRGPHNRLGFAIQLGTVRFLGTFLRDLGAVPEVVIAMMANQLDIKDTSCLEIYRVKESRLDHTAEIRQWYGYRNFTDQPVPLPVKNGPVFAILWTHVKVAGFKHQIRRIVNRNVQSLFKP